MEESKIGDFTWSLPRNPWTDACEKHEEDKKFLNLNDLEYPELNGTVVKNKNSVIQREECLLTPNIARILLPMQTNTEPKRSIKRYKKSDRISINLQEALQNTICSTNMGKEVPKLKINLYMNNLGFTLPNSLDKNKCSDLRKVKMCISKNKKPSKVKKIILLNRNMKAQINVEKKEIFECKKMEAICKDVDTINFNALKITTDPETDVDCIKNMWTMTLYGKNYRNINEINISDNTLSHRSDVIGKINDLGIQGRQLTNKLVARNNRTHFSNFISDIIENDIAKQTRSLHIKEDVKPEVQNNADMTDDKNSVKFSRNFREYCTNTLTATLNDNLEKFVERLTMLQKRYHERNPNKSKYKRRYYSGLKEVRKHAELKQLKFVIVAPDIEKIELENGLDDQVNQLLDICRKENIVFCFGLRRRKLGYYTHGKGFVGCIGIANYGGTELLFKNVLMELVTARNAFEKLNAASDAIVDISKVISEDDLLSENINALLKFLS
ncbi:hypothetical protein E2986_00727 [Frieseomelitta varia]|uniref:Ribosomal protein eL8/eL30/eS12/Gadd45 domain-containing protein n=1 Tax=Frieseomelitta varia TaxID=561572 RepID=A0A833W9X2_9HYME|nr:uncharacterized protein LOC122538603 [Frieseomelitta varia]KAF3429237.1 hypothetical protein E2986_00727 [Frieseomelitta varia]